jgi:hypothetical protein
MAGTEWVTTEQKVFLQELYSEFLKAQLHSTLSAFWTEVYRGWFEKWPEISVIYPDVSNHGSLTDEQKKMLGVAVKKRQQVGVILVQNSQMLTTHRVATQDVVQLPIAKEWPCIG